MKERELTTWDSKLLRGYKMPKKYVVKEEE